MVYFEIFQYKQKKHDSDPFLLISGEDDKNSEWLAVDLGKEDIV